MYRDHTVGVVVPAYNEEGYVGEVIDTMPTYVDRVYVVDDASTDGTWEEISEHAAAANEEHDPEAPGFDTRVVPLQHEENRGVGGAIKTGYLHALDDGIDLVAVMGGDGQMDPDGLPGLLDPLVDDEADYAKGNRFMGEDLEAMPRFRLVGNVLLTALTKFASGYWRISDPQNGYTAITREALETVDVEEMYEFYGYCNDLLVKLNDAGMRVVDVPRPSSFNYGEDWKSHIQYEEYIPRVSWMLFRNFLWRLRRQRGAAAFAYVLAGLLAVGGVAALAARRRGGLLTVAGLGLLVAAAALDHRENEALGRKLDHREGGGGEEAPERQVEPDAVR